ncbi:hypothetical protein ABT288_43560 [Streptomyces sp. NPDC001093]|uniref:hypothetical protein n=1 Tax=Streptomyces sp. NPDC001093 TaxID=3154376 RepID=UPI00332FEAB1
MFAPDTATASGMLEPKPWGGSTRHPNLHQTPRITEAEQEGWLGEIEGLQVSLASAEEKLTQLDAEQVRQRQVIDLGMPHFSQIATRISTAKGSSS